MSAPNKSHAFQVGIQADMDDIESAAEKAANAVNTYLGAVYADVSLDTQGVVSIGVGQSAGGDYHGTAIGFMADGGDDESDEETDGDVEIEEHEHDGHVKGVDGGVDID